MARIWIKGYTKPDGTKVKGHYREAPTRYYDGKRQRQYAGRIRLGQSPTEAARAVDAQTDRRRDAGKRASVTARAKYYGRALARGATGAYLKGLKI